MKIIVWIEPQMSVSNWYRELENGLRAALSNRRLKARFQVLEEPDRAVEQGSFIILAGETYEWYNRMLAFTNERRITACVTGCEHPMYSAITVTSNYAQVLYNMVQYLHDAGKRKVAFFAINPSSPHDICRLEGFQRAVAELKMDCGDEDIYFTNGDISQCSHSFQKHISSYDAVLGTNDLYAFFALMIAKRAGLRVPEDLYIAGFGNTTISMISKPPITTATVDLYNIGYQAINAIHLMNNDESLIELRIKSDDVYFARESTDCQPFSDKYRNRSNMSPYLSQFNAKDRPISSFDDEAFMDVVNYETLLKHIDQIDYSIIRSIIEKKISRRSQMAEACFLSDTALDYRLKKLYARFRVTSYSEFYNKLVDMAANIDITKVTPV